VRQCNNQALRIDDPSANARQCLAIHERPRASLERICLLHMLLEEFNFGKSTAIQMSMQKTFQPHSKKGSIARDTRDAPSDRWIRFRPLIPLIALLFPAAIHASSLESTTLAAWEEYIECANIQAEQRLVPGKTFLWMDEVPGRLAKVRAGEIVVLPVGTQNPKRVPSGLIHDWVGTAFIPGATLQDVFQVVRDYPRYKEWYRPIVVDSKAISAAETKDRFSMLLMNKSFFKKTALDTEYESGYVHIDSRRGYSISRTTRIQEIEDYGSSAQRVLPAGEGNGIIWRLFSIMRFEERDGGVYIELEAIGLSRDIPFSVRWAVEPLVRRVSRGSLSTSLRQTANAVNVNLEAANSKAGQRTATIAMTSKGDARDQFRAPVSVESSRVASNQAIPYRSLQHDQ